MTVARPAPSASGTPAATNVAPGGVDNETVYFL